MSIHFSEITLSDPSGLVAQGLIKGHPDEDDLRGDESLREVADEFEFQVEDLDDES